jgi:hypothetical protein
MSIHLLEFFNKFPCILFISRFIAVLKKVRYALCPMPYALCPVVPHLSEKGYIWLHNKLFTHWLNLMHHARVCLSRGLSSLTTVLSWRSPHKKWQSSSPGKWHSSQAYTTSSPAAISGLCFDKLSAIAFFLIISGCFLDFYTLAFSQLDWPAFKLR